MHTLSTFARDHGRLALRILALALAFAAGLGWGGAAWLPMVPALYLLGRRYGTACSRDMAAQRQYGVGAALAGFNPHGRE